MLCPEPKFLFNFIGDPSWEEDDFDPEELYDDEEEWDDEEE